VDMDRVRAAGSTWPEVSFLRQAILNKTYSPRIRLPLAITFFLGLPTRQLADSPYVQALTQAIDVRARDVGHCVAPGAYIDLPPNIAGYVGGDHTTMILATEIWRTAQTVLALDIGTNTEISLARNGQLYSCLCASGPTLTSKRQ
jgi:uncharacterized 2Fe-2S/4Fe-4S cluster protein (DUF4445 family)